MPPICCICMENKINNNNRCNTCKKSICDECYIKMSNFDLTTPQLRYKYKCGFCKSHTFKNIDDLDRGIICNELERQVKHNMLLTDQYEELSNEKYMLGQEYNDRLDEIRELQLFNRKLMNRIPKEDDKVKEVSINKPTKYNIFFKENFSKIKTLNPEKHSSLIMKEIGILWQEEKRKRS